MLCTLRSLSRSRPRLAGFPFTASPPSSLFAVLHSITRCSSTSTNTAPANHPASHPSNIDADVITPSRFDALMQQALASDYIPPSMVVGVSGGADSTALALLLQEWGERHICDVIAVVVDHQLRADSAAEAQETVRALRHDFGLHTVLRRLHWDKTGKPSAQYLQQVARERRRDALMGVCAARGARWLCLGHHLSDVLETFLMRTARGSGVLGLPGPALSSQWLDYAHGGSGVTVLRPLLHTPRAAIDATCARFGYEPVYDPSNVDDRFDRVRARQGLAELLPTRSVEELLPAYAPSPPSSSSSPGSAQDSAQLSTARLVHMVETVRQARERVHMYTTAQLQQLSVLVTPLGYAQVNMTALFREPQEVQHVLLSRIISVVRGTPMPPRRRGRTATLDAFKPGRTVPRRRDLGGCIMEPVASSSDSDDCVVLVYRDGSKVDKETPAHTASSKRGATFDERFWLAGPRFAIRPLDRPALLERAVRVLGGKRARRQLRRVLPPFLLRSGLPALCSLPNQRVLRVPHLPLLRPKREDPSPRAAFWVQPLANWTGKANLL